MPDLSHLLFMSTDLAKELPSRVVELRKAAGLTQVHVCEKLGITKGRYGHYETGIRRFPISLIPKLAEALGCSEADLFANQARPKKRGPTSRIEQVAERISKLPRKKQAMILDMVEGAIDKAS